MTPGKTVGTTGKHILLRNGFRIDLDDVPSSWVIEWLTRQEHSRRLLDDARRPRLRIEVGNQGPELERPEGSPGDAEDR